MKRRKLIKVYLGMIKADAPKVDLETVRVAIESMWAELRASWTVVKAAQAYRRARQEESGQAIAERELYEALDAYEGGQDG